MKSTCQAGRARRLAPFGVMLMALACLAIVGGCPSGVSMRGRGSDKTIIARETFRPIPEDASAAARPPSRRALLADALRGVTTKPDADLGSRFEVRPLRRPHPRPGSSARFNFDGGKRGWVTALPSHQLLTTPAFANGKLYLGGGFGSARFFAFNAYDGDLVWSRGSIDNGASAALVEGHKVIFNTDSCTLYVADAATGKLDWKRWLGAPLMSQPVASDRLLLSAYPHNGDYRLGAFQLADGKPVWSVPIAADIIQAPQAAGDSVYFATVDGTAERVRVHDGHVVWKRDVGASSALWVDGDNVLLARRSGTRRHITEEPIVLSATNGRLRSVAKPVDAPYLGGGTRDRTLAEKQPGPKDAVPHGARLGLDSAPTAWAFQGSTPAVADGRAYFAIGGDIRARDMATGAVVWHRHYADARGAQALSPPVVVGSALVFGSVDGKLYATDIDTGMTLWAYDIGEPIVFQPIVAQGWVYVATGKGNLIGLEVGDPAFDGWHMWGGNARHDGLVTTAGTVDPALLASLQRPGRGTLRVARVDIQHSTRSGAVPVPPGAAAATQAHSITTHKPAPAPHPDLPLVSTRVDAHISGMVARVTVTQRFDNRGEAPIEGLYLFPLPQDSAVDAMEMHIGKRIIRGEIERRGRARRTYQHAKAAGKHAALLEQQRPNLFAQRVANIPPGAHIDVRIEYVETLPFEDGHYELVYPMVAPRHYDPHDPSAVVSRAGVVRQASDTRIHVSIDAGMPIGRLASPTHRITVVRPDRTHAEVDLASGTHLPDKDFVLRYAVGGRAPRAAVFAYRKSRDPGYFSLVVQPPDAPASNTIAPRDLTFLVDISSSMRGRPIDHARAVMRRLLKDLHTRDTFRILAFNDHVQALSSRALADTRANVQRADAFIDGLSPTGSTDMAPAVQRALAASGGGPGRLSMVVLITDGYIGNEADVLRAIAAHLGSTRLYTVGVGSSVNRFLLDRAAEIGRGRSLVTTLSGDPAAAARRFAAWIDAPVFTDVDVDWGGLAVSDVYPRRLPDLFEGKPLVLHGRYARGGHAIVKVKGTVNGRRYERVVDVTLPDHSANDANAAHATLWARAAVHDRMNQLYLHDDPRLIEQVTDIGLAHHLVTQWTSFVAVDETSARHAAPSGAFSPTVPVHATITPSRALPGDPEIRIPAPADARAVTVILPFGDTLAAAYEPELGMWTARFLIPDDAADGPHPIQVLVTRADGSRKHFTLWYTVDTSAPLVHAEVVGKPTPGSSVTLRATQVITGHDLAEVGYARGTMLTGARVRLLGDARTVEARLPSGKVIELRHAGPGAWAAPLHIPDDARGTLRLSLTVVDLAANVRTQPFNVHVERGR